MLLSSSLFISKSGKTQASLVGSVFFWVGVWFCSVLIVLKDNTKKNTSRACWDDTALGKNVDRRNNSTWWWSPSDDEATWFAFQAVTVWEKENTLDERDARDECRD